MDTQSDEVRPDHDIFRRWTKILLVSRKKSNFQWPASHALLNPYGIPLDTGRRAIFKSRLPSLFTFIKGHAMKQSRPRFPASLQRHETCQVS
ncbi:hypothetical protein PDE_03653 [Penicillium oxalicum 114-2]|uniref:Uncharacterized protein n=1 Tax=Penicillium oxalicum (strain 114-2 / CGMCC 5302) TaxID=933388 RepID=S8B2P3_PENO1|nr:hypothetical protein PDE_03653 [Penicillium oxalicum 114-2]